MAALLLHIQDLLWPYLPSPNRPIRAGSSVSKRFKLSWQITCDSVAQKSHRPHSATDLLQTALLDSASQTRQQPVELDDMALLLARTSLRLRVPTPVFQARRLQHSIFGPEQPLANSPPTVRPSIVDRKLPEPHAPQTAGPKPPPPTPTREKPRLRATKAALTLVSGTMVAFPRSCADTMHRGRPPTPFGG
jgi:hypothetical protein